MVGVKVDARVDLGGVQLPGPVLVASGCFGTGRELGAMFDRKHLGGVVSRSITAMPRKGAPTPRLAETPSGFLSRVGLQNPGVEAFVAGDLLHIASLGLPVVVSVAGGSAEEYVRVAAMLDGAPGVVALEVYLSCPDEEIDGRPFYERPERAAEITGAVARRAPVPVFAKLPSMSEGLLETAGACVRAGAHGLTLIDGVPALGVAAETLSPALGAVTGFLSGPAVRPIALRAIFEVAQELPHVPIFGVGGIWNGQDAAEMLLAGAWAVQVGTATLVDPAAPARVTRDLGEYLRSKDLASPADLRGRLRLPGPRSAELAPPEAGA